MTDVGPFSMVLFDIDGTLVRSFMREGGGGADRAYDLIELLPGRREAIQGLLEDGIGVALVTNQGGVAFGYQTVDQVGQKIARLLSTLGIPPAGVTNREPYWRCVTEPTDAAAPAHAYVAFTHPNAKLAEYRLASDWRKPGGGMIRQALRDHQRSAAEVVYVGDMDSDREAARDAGVAYLDVSEFFGEVVEVPGPDQGEA